MSRGNLGDLRVNFWRKGRIGRIGRKGGYNGGMRVGFAGAVGLVWVLWAAAAVGGCAQDASAPVVSAPRGTPVVIAATAVAGVGAATDAAVVSTATAVASPTVVVSATVAGVGETAGADSSVDGVSGRGELPTRNLFEIAQRLGTAAQGGDPLERTIPADPDCCDVGHRQRFFVADLYAERVYEVDALLRAVSENAYWYVDEAVSDDVSDARLRAAADAFEGRIRPAIVRNIGDIWRPGVDNDARLTVLNTPLNGAAGYYGASDEYPRATHPYSNQREMIYMDAGGLRYGGDAYLSVLAHEFQHAVHWHLDGGEDVWVNEGMAEMAAHIAGYRIGFVRDFLRAPETQLNFWPDEPSQTPRRYGAASLFMAYIAQHYGGYAGLAELAREQRDGVNGVERYLSKFGATFAQVFEDWVIANYLDEDEGKYGYAEFDTQALRVESVDTDIVETRAQPQLSARYYDIRFGEGDAIVRFDGNASVAQVNTDCRSGRFCYWSGAGDLVDTALEREFDLSDTDDAMLEFWMWRDIERDWDYGYVSASADEGATWTLLEGEYTTRTNPLGNNFGAGVTGKGDWARERMDLSAYAGESRVRVRFEYITDEGVNLDGWVIDDIGIPQIGYFDDAESGWEWRYDGFGRIDNRLRQVFAVQIIEIGADGAAAVRKAALTAGGDGRLTGEWRIAGFGGRIERAVVVVAPMTHTTYRPAEYTLRIEAVEGE